MLASVLRSLGRSVAAQTDIAFSVATATTIIYAVTIATLSFLWGDVYHVQRHGDV